jgi:hypothetical protein
MNPTTLFSTAVLVAAAFVHPLQAESDKKSKKDDHSKKGHSQPSAVAQTQAHPQYNPAQAQHSGPQHHNPAQKGGKGAGHTAKQSYQQPGHHGQTVAVAGDTRRTDVRGGSSYNAYRSGSGYSSYRSVTHSDYGYSHPPESAYRGWDRGGVHSWNNHNYRWYDNNWIVIDVGYGAPYYAGGYGYSSRGYGDLAVSVQRELSRRGYDTGGVDGVIGPQTRNAIAAFQGDHGLAVTGRIDEALVRSLRL